MATELKLKSHGRVIRTRRTLSCHASTVLPLADGRVLAAWFGGSREGGGDVGIWMAERDGETFSEARLVTQGAQPHWNPVLFERTDGTILLFYKVGWEIPDWRTMVMESADGGRTWSQPRELVPGDDSGGRGPVRNKPIRLDDGSVLAPASVERGIWRCFVDRSDDDCRSWRRSAPIEISELNAIEPELLRWNRCVAAGECRREDVPDAYCHGRGVIQPTLWQDADGAVHALMRSGEGWIYRSDSCDRGKTWSEPRPIRLPNNNSGIDLARLEGGTLVLCCNPVAENFGARSPISLFLSEDNGETWTRLCDLETGPGEFSYPAVAARGSRLLITYTWQRESIVYWEFEIHT